MAVYRTAQGKQLDMSALVAKNEKTRAVGNMKVNARGDQLGQGGQVVATRNEMMNQQYKIRGTQIGADDPVQVENVAPDGESFDPPFVEEIKPVEPKLRGSLADSIAKQKTVEQKPMDKDMYKPKGPQRI